MVRAAVCRFTSARVPALVTLATTKSQAQNRQLTYDAMPDLK
jgi:hypothetical protein